jgi:hypothetical protein
MTYLQITYRQGTPFAAYLYLPRRPGDKAARTERQGAFLVDLSADGRAVGVEFTRVGGVDLAALNHILAASGQGAVSRGELGPMEGR